MKSIPYISTVILFVFYFTSCSKNKDNSNPTISLVSPKENDTLKGIQSEYSIQFEAQDDKNLSKESLKITDELGTILTSEERDIYGSSYTYENTFTFGGTSGKTKKLNLLITIEDQAKNKTEKTIPFFVKL